MSCLLRLSTPLKSNFKALFSRRNRLRALSDAILLLAGRRHVGHKNAYRLNAHGSTCTLVAGTQDVALGIQHAMHMCHIVLWPTHFYNIFPHCLTDGTIFKNVIKHKMCASTFFTFVWNISHSKKTRSRQDQKCTLVFT